MSVLSLFRKNKTLWDTTGSGRGDYKRDNSIYPIDDIDYSIGNAIDLHRAAIELVNIDTELSTTLFYQSAIWIDELREMLVNGSLMILVNFKKEVVCRYFDILKKAESLNDEINQTILLIEPAKDSEKIELLLTQSFVLLDYTAKEIESFHKQVASGFLMDGEDNGLIAAFEAA